MPSSAAPFRLDESVVILSRTPSVLSALLDGLADSWLQFREAEGTFSAHDVLGHLVYGEQTDWIVRARIILEHGEARPFTTFDRRGHEGFAAIKSTRELLREFADLRAANLEALHTFSLDERLLDATGMHPELGRVTMRQLLATWVAHDLSHIAQIVRVMAKRQRDEVGPWREYLTILR